MHYKIYNYHNIGEDRKQIQEFLDAGFYIVQCDASHHYDTKRGSASVGITAPDGKEYTLKDSTFKSPGPYYAEMKSIVYGLREIQKIKKEIKNTLLLNDNFYAVNFAAGNFTPKKPHIKQVTSEIMTELEKIGFGVQLGLVRSKVNRKVDKSAKKTLKSKEKEIDKRIEKRVQEVLKNIEKGKAFENYTIVESIVSLKDPNSDYWFNVIFEPYPACTGYWWRQKWEPKGEQIIRARALPCSHMCRAAELLGLNIFDVFRKQIFRRD